MECQRIHSAILDHQSEALCTLGPRGCPHDDPNGLRDLRSFLPMD